MFDMDEFLENSGFAEKGWETDGFGLDSCLICPCGITIEQDGRCSNGHVSPLRQLGMI